MKSVGLVSGVHISGEAGSGARESCSGGGTELGTLQRMSNSGQRHVFSRWSNVSLTARYLSVRPVHFAPW